ncbi:PREDICTED: cell division cycle protein 16 homolog [Amphimedon queenslandica]|uniref:Uncharacterized protein n=1 Tax=Amphimedon queenslandica TaxID=400682 RepID=A0A1X7ULH6_AMPQE|nr:PREDICTED: cell division cycle protein 16 homolog [Amphimedon queenslandica]|eukprot:XP_003387587.2 PREDICTED: cell division cycle protein 16 homolog [Amphimedon queenslandica]
MIKSSMDTEGLLIRFRQLADDYNSKMMPETAAFWAEKALLLSEEDIDDLVLYCQCLYNSGQWRRAASCLQNSPLLTKSSSLRYLAAKCLAACKAWGEVVSLLTGGPAEEEDGGLMDEGGGAQKKEDLVSIRLGHVSGAPMYMLLGRAYEGTGNVSEAIACYKDVLAEDSYCEEALEQLYALRALQGPDEHSLVSSLSFSGEEEKIMQYLYQSKLCHYKKPYPLLEKAKSLVKSIDVQSRVASSLLDKMDIEKCKTITSSILKKDPYHSPTLLTHVACLVIQKSSVQLYSLGQDLVKNYPESPLSWYVVSSYYYCIGKHPQARRYLAKSINLDPHFAHAHIMYGLSFASEGEHDQAITAFGHAARYLKSSHVPMMYLGKEYFVTGNLPISISFYKNALALAPQNPALCSEVGMVLSSSGRYDKAEAYFTQAVSILQTMDPNVTLHSWEPIYNNLGHVQRKLGKYPEALKAHKKALQLCPSEPETLTAIAFVYLLMEDYTQVVQYCNQSLRLRREDQFTIEVMQTAVGELASLPLTFSSVEDESVLDQLVYGENGACPELKDTSSVDMQTD